MSRRYGRVADPEHPGKGLVMKKFLVLYKSARSEFEKAMKSTPEQQKAGMDAWTNWSKKAASSIVDMGGPLGKSLRVTQGGTSPVVNDLGGYSVLQAESKEALAATMKGHPHFLMGPESSIEIIELMPIPGM
jgi:hypothetical protein